MRQIIETGLCHVRAIFAFQPDDELFVQPGIAGIVKISRLAYPDATQFDPKSKYYDSASKPDNPRWLHVDVKFVKKTRTIGLPELRSHQALANMRILARGNRLSITPVDPAEWEYIMKLL